MRVRALLVLVIIVTLSGTTGADATCSVPSKAELYDKEHRALTTRSPHTQAKARTYFSELFFCFNKSRDLRLRSLAAYAAFIRGKLSRDLPEVVEWTRQAYWLDPTHPEYGPVLIELQEQRITQLEYLLRTKKRRR